MGWCLALCAGHTVLEVNRLASRHCINVCRMEMYVHKPTGGLNSAFRAGTKIYYDLMNLS